MIHMAYIYQNRKGVEQNYSIAIKLYNQAIALGNTDAMNNLANMYEHGEHLKKYVNVRISLPNSV